MPRKSKKATRKKPVRQNRFTGHHARRFVDQAIEVEDDEEKEEDELDASEDDQSDDEEDE